MTISLQREITARVKPPRALFLHWPLGHPFGEPGRADQQRAVCLAALDLVRTAQEPGAIVDAPWRWRRARYDDPLDRGARADDARAPP